MEIDCFDNFFQNRSKAVFVCAITIVRLCVFYITEAKKLKKAWRFGNKTLNLQHRNKINKTRHYNNKMKNGAKKKHKDRRRTFIVNTKTVALRCNM